MTVTGPGGRDPGMQPERTALAWQRTAVSSLLLSLVAMGAAAHRITADAGPAGHLRPTSAAALAVGVAVLAAMLAATDAVVVVPREVHGIAGHPTSGRLASPYRRLVLMAGATLLLAVAGALLASAGLNGR